MSKEKILAIIDTDFIAADARFWDYYSECYKGPEIPYLMISMLENGKVQFHDIYTIEFKEITQEIVFRGKSDEDSFFIPLKDVPKRIDSEFLTSDSVFFQTSSLTFAEIYLGMIRKKLNLNNEERITWRQHILDHSNFIINLLNFYAIQKVKRFVDPETNGITFDMVTNIQKLNEFIFPIMVPFYIFFNDIFAESNWKFEDKDRSFISKPTQSYCGWNPKKIPTFIIDLKGFHSNPFFIVVREQEEDGRIREISHLITHIDFRNLVSNREFGYEVIHDDHPDSVTDKIYMEEMDNLRIIKEEILSTGNTQLLQQICSLNREEIGKLPIKL